MSYEEKRKKAIQKKTGKQLTCTIHKFTEPGDYIVGKLLAVEDFIGEKIKEKCNKYVLETDAEVTSCILGGATDKQLDTSKLIGRVISIDYHGQTTLQDGRAVNKFTVVDVTDA